MQEAIGSGEGSIKRQKFHDQWNKIWNNHLANIFSGIHHSSKSIQPDERNVKKTLNKLPPSNVKKS